MLLAYEITGTGVPLVMLHAFPLSHAMWHDERQTLSPLGRIICPDLPGFGRSQQQVEPSIPAMASLLIDLLDQLSIREPIMLAGLSMGGYVALEFFRQFPERVLALGLFSTRAGIDTPEARATRLKTAETIRREGLNAFAQAMPQTLLGRTTLSSQPKLAQAISQLIASNNPHGVADALLAMANRRDSTPILASIMCPTLILSGEEDVVIPPTESEELHRRIGGSSYQVIPAAGHLVNLEQPKRFQEILGHFIRERVLAPS